ncbi:hypothetical protein N7532_010294 [Penicillium argentinense]|uniref:Uncharacterized protein n=1 Tax=Penicillium argentinense TaxID=1131581 RepID=A0A9W9EPA7_9EURO|nr:uncharacterized protein N7532_010294 [Penicillium argentinense]KAJ5085523.1 hypothetical protein N7532_010294 [Penicillium argentinense]
MIESQPWGAVLGNSAPKVNATQCALYWCTKSISARMSGNKLKETHVETRTDTSAQYQNIFLRLSPPKNDRFDSDFSDNSNSGFVYEQLKKARSISWHAKKLDINSLGNVNFTDE